MAYQEASIKGRLITRFPNLRTCPDEKSVVVAKMGDIASSVQENCANIAKLKPCHLARRMAFGMHLLRQRLCAFRPLKSQGSLNCGLCVVSSTSMVRRLVAWKWCEGYSSHQRSIGYAPGLSNM